MTDPILFSIIIPIRIENNYIKETLNYISQQTFRQFEVLVITDKISRTSNPAIKRNIGANMAKGKYLVFLDDDSYPQKNFLSKLNKLFTKHPNIAGVCGPALTPINDNAYQKASGLVLSSFLGSGGAGTYRNSLKTQRYVDDYPTVNLTIKKTYFNQIGGFNIKYWPGEDTLLCLKITHRLNKRILYHPDVIVYHHRRSIFLPHLKQISRYALHRGYFVKKFPQTSFRFGYFIPSIFFIYLAFLPIHHFYIPLYLYLLLTLYTFFVFLVQKNSLYTSVLASLSILPTHLVYGIFFIIGLSRRKLYFTAHKINLKTGNYIGG